MTQDCRKARKCRGSYAFSAVIAVLGNDRGTLRERENGPSGMKWRKGKTVIKAVFPFVPSGRGVGITVGAVLFLEQLSVFGGGEQVQ